MKPRWLKAARIACAALCFVAGGVQAVTYNVTIKSPGLTALAATLAFDLLDGGAPGNSVAISPLASNGTPTGTTTTGGVTGDAVAGWILSDTDFFNELLVTFGPLGDELSFSFTPTDIPPDAGSSPDAFSFFMLDATGLAPLFPTTDPAGALIVFEFGSGAAGLQVFAAAELDAEAFSIRVAPAASVPEPATLALVATALLLMAGYRTRRIRIAQRKR